MMEEKKKKMSIKKRKKDKENMFEKRKYIYEFINIK
jgi:hypothetical protein